MASSQGLTSLMHTYNSSTVKGSSRRTRVNADADSERLGHLQFYGVMFEFRVPYSQWYLVLGFVGLGLHLLLWLRLVGLALWLVSGIGLNKCRCEYGTLR